MNEKLKNQDFDNLFKAILLLENVEVHSFP